jgi:hypothetical protein
MAISGDSISGDIIPAIPGMPGVPIGGYIPGDSAKRAPASYAVPAGYPYASYATATPEPEPEPARALAVSVSAVDGAPIGGSVTPASKGRSKVAGPRLSASSEFRASAAGALAGTSPGATAGTLAPASGAGLGAAPGDRTPDATLAVPCLATSANRGGAGARVQ